MCAVVDYKGAEEIVYEDLHSWKLINNCVVLLRTRRDLIIIPIDQITCIEIHPD